MEQPACENISVTCQEPVIVRAETKTPSGFYFLSNIDHFESMVPETVYLYKLGEDDGGNKRRTSESPSEIIRKSLAKVLVHYYPMSGRLKIGPDGKFGVDCTNEGVLFVEATADCSINVVGDISLPDYTVLRKLVYVLPNPDKITEQPLMTAQVTMFKGGDFVLGLAINHCMADGRGAMEFVNSWAETARGLPLTNPPFLDRTLIKPRHPPQIERFIETTNIRDMSNIGKLHQEEQTVLKSFYVDADKLANLKKLANENGSPPNTYSSFTVLAALLWRARCKALKMDTNQETKLMFSVDIRSRLKEPELPKGYFGNAVVVPTCQCSAGELIEQPLSFAAKMVQSTIQGVNQEFIQSYIDYFDETRPMPSFTASLMITSWTRIPFHSADFGWGDATQFGPCLLPPDSALFTPYGKENKGIIVVLGLPVSAMNTLQELMPV